MKIIKDAFNTDHKSKAKFQSLLKGASFNIYICGLSYVANMKDTTKTENTIKNVHCKHHCNMKLH